MQEDVDARDELSKLGDAIVSIVNDGFRRTSRVGLLSNLGQDLRKAGIDYTALLEKRRLAEYIRSDLSDRVVLVSIPGKEKAIGIHPIGVDVGTAAPATAPNASSTADQTTSSVPAPATLQQRPPLIHSQVWFAFSHFLAENERRILRLRPEPVYQDVPASTVENGSGFPIDRELIVPVGSLAKHERDALIYENIVKWASGIPVPLDELVVRKAERSERADRRNLLDELLRALGHAELSRVSMPLDVIKTLRERRL